VLVLTGCCKEKKPPPQPPTEPAAVVDTQAERAIWQTIDEVATGDRKGVVSKVSAMRKRNELTVVISTKLYPKPENEHQGRGLCNTIIGGTYAGSKVTDVGVNASDGSRLAWVFNGRCHLNRTSAIDLL
jgi:hypothetical protein